MPPPTKVRLEPHDAQWAVMARREIGLLTTALGDGLVEVHHIGSTAIPGIAAKPVIDLLAEVRELTLFDQCQHALEGLGYGWRGEHGLPGRRYCVKDDPQTGRRGFQLHCYAEGSPEIARHLAFRDRLRGDPALAKAYEDEKRRCQQLHPNNSHAYTYCKSDWIERVEREISVSRAR